MSFERRHFFKVQELKLYQHCKLLLLSPQPRLAVDSLGFVQYTLRNLWAVTAKSATDKQTNKKLFANKIGDVPCNNLFLVPIVIQRLKT